jgi:hypothetical protein
MSRDIRDHKRRRFSVYQLLLAAEAERIQLSFVDFIAFSSEVERVVVFREPFWCETGAVCISSPA